MAAINSIYIVGFGSQGSVWAKILRHNGWQVTVILPAQSNSRHAAIKLGCRVLSFDDPEFSAQCLSIRCLVWACPDLIIPKLYNQYFANAGTALASQSIDFLLIHGLAIQSKQLQPRPNHTFSLLAPKAIGPQIERAYFEHTSTHTLKAAFLESSTNGITQTVAQTMGFKPENLIPSSFEEETIGDLISEQGLLCGGIFTLLVWTVAQMRKSGIPEALIIEECYTELSLIADLIKKLGPEKTFLKISDAAKLGASGVFDTLSSQEFGRMMDPIADRIRDGSFQQSLFNSSDQQKLDIREKMRSLQRALAQLPEVSR